MELSEHLRKISKERWNKATKEEKVKHMRMMARARWDKKSPDVSEKPFQEIQS